MRLLSSFLWVLIGLVSHAVAFLPPQNWENLDVQKNVDLLKSYVKEKYLFEIRNINELPNENYYFALPTYLKPDVSFIVAFVATGRSKVALHVDAMDEMSDDGLISFYKFALPFPIAAKSKATISVSLAYTNQIIPMPEKIELGDPQTAYFTANKLPLSPYDTLSCVVKFVGLIDAQELEITSWDDENVEGVEGKVENEALIYGPIERTVKPYSNHTFGLLHSKITPIPYVYKLNRDVWVSHWGNSVTFDEHYQLSNKAAKLKSGFSRADWMRGKYAMKPGPVISSLNMKLPDASREIYYNDLVGNVSTSVVSGNNVALKPRYPIFGGWFYNFTLGWTNDMKDFVSNFGDHEHVLKVPLLNGPLNTAYEEVFLSVYLPENAELVSVDSPIDFEYQDESTAFSYLDMVKGHTKVTIKYKNLVDELRKVDVLVHYKYTTFAQLAKPLSVALYLFLALVGVYLLSKIDVSVSK